MSNLPSVKKNVNNGEIAGYCDRRFERVAEEFEKYFRERGEVGASVCVKLAGETFVDLWGGSADPSSNKPWVEDTITPVWSCTKGATALVRAYARFARLARPRGAGSALLARIWTGR